MKFNNDAVSKTEQVSKDPSYSVQRSDVRRMLPAITIRIPVLLGMRASWSPGIALSLQEHKSIPQSKPTKFSRPMHSDDLSLPFSKNLFCTTSFEDLSQEGSD